MYGQTGGMHSGGMFFGGGIFMWIFWIILLVALIYILKTIFGSGKRNISASDEALEILRQRFAKGEIDEEEYEKRKKQLQ